jgi:deoxyribodipyrimidine photo-lyase
MFVYNVTIKVKHEIHEPWLYLDGYSKGYSERIVDHALERLESLARLQEIKADKLEKPAKI